MKLAFSTLIVILNSEYHLVLKKHRRCSVSYSISFSTEIYILCEKISSHIYLISVECTLPFNKWYNYVYIKELFKNKCIY